MTLTKTQRLLMVEESHRLQLAGIDYQAAFHIVINKRRFLPPGTWEAFTPDQQEELANVLMGSPDVSCPCASCKRFVWE